MNEKKDSYDSLEGWLFIFFLGMFVMSMVVGVISNKDTIGEIIFLMFNECWWLTASISFVGLLIIFVKWERE
jgi:hypothetical protein